MQSEELQLLCSLGREAAEILWEMAAYQKDVHEEADGSTTEMLEKGELLKVQPHCLLMLRQGALLAEPTACT